MFPFSYIASSAIICPLVVLALLVARFSAVLLLYLALSLPPEPPLPLRLFSRSMLVVPAYPLPMYALRAALCAAARRSL